MPYMLVTVPVATGEPSPKSHVYWMLAPCTSDVPFRRVDTPEMMSWGIAGLLESTRTVLTTGGAP
jgi:hypothetical protein